LLARPTGYILATPPALLHFAGRRIAAIAIANAVKTRLPRPSHPACQSPSDYIGVTVEIHPSMNFSDLSPVIVCCARGVGVVCGDGGLFNSHAKETQAVLA
jgi:hypothetical protein